MDGLVEDRRVFGITEDWSTAAPDLGVWYSTVREGSCRFMTAWVREEKNTSENRQRKREAEEIHKLSMGFHLG